MKGRPALIPQYMQDFSCIGPSCEDSCCIGWRVMIDEQTYKKYRRVKNEELKPLLDKRVTRNRSNPSKKNYAKVKFNKNGTCPFLTEDKWCKIQLHLGEEYLSETCSFYPRTVNRVNGVIEKSATVSCPEVTRMALLNPEGIEFDETLEQVEKEYNISKDIDTKLLAYAHKPQRYFWELRVFSIQVLQNRSYELWERLIVLGLFYQKLQEYMENEQIHEIPELMARYTNLMDEGSMGESLRDIPVQTTIQMKLLKELTDKRFSQGINNKRYLECLTQFLKGLQYSAESTDEENGDRYQDAYQNYYLPYMKDRQYILENYLVNFIFKNLFPLGGSKTVFEEYVMLVIHYALIKLHLIGLSAYHKGLNDELVVKLIQSFAKTVEHNAHYLRQVRELLKDSELDTMAYMTILIKN